jgi:hypothetical protein
VVLLTGHIFAVAFYLMAAVLFWRITIIFAGMAIIFVPLHVWAACGVIRD